MSNDENIIPRWFSCDVDIFSDEKIQLANAKFDGHAFPVYLFIVTRCMKKNGYYRANNNEMYEYISMNTYIKVGKVRQIVSYLLKISLLVSKNLNGVTVITSPEIQRRWMRAVSETHGKRMQRGAGPIELEPSIWMAEIKNPKYFVLKSPKNKGFDTKMALSETKEAMSETNAILSVREERRRDETRLDEYIYLGEEKEYIRDTFGEDCLLYYEARYREYYGKKKFNYNKIQQFIAMDKANKTGFFRNVPFESKKKPNFEQRKYDFDALTQKYIEKVNSKGENVT